LLDRSRIVYRLRMSTPIHVVLSLWREAERALRELDPSASEVERMALVAQVEDLRALYRRTFDELRDVESSPSPPPAVQEGRGREARLPR